jgi:hypothetical protein
MAVIYTKTSGEQITIGGTVSTGPFPKYSVLRSNIRTSDDTILGSKYSIKVSGKIITDSSASVTVTGEMQSNLHGKIITKLQTDITTGHNIGRLEITPYGGLSNTIEFLDARLVDIEIPEQSDDSSGILYSDYAFTFEAYEDISNSSESSFSYALNSAEENWEITIDDSETVYGDSGLTLPYRTYTITHTVSATGRKKITAGPDFSSSAWKQAADWVKSRLVTSPASAIITDAVGNTEFTNFYPEYFDSATGAASTDLTSMSYYNHTRTPQCDINGGTYSVTETWKASTQPATLDMEVNVEQDDNQVINITLSGTITGLDSSSLNSTAITKLANAETVLTLVDAAAYTLCNSYYTDSGTLESVVRSKSIGRNKGTGVITFSYTYNDTPVLLDNAISTSVQLTDDNEYKLNEIVAVIPIIAKEDGPVIQDMGTTNESKRSVQIDAVMDKDNRTTKPAAGKTLALTYAPTGAYLQSLVETWEPGTGAYTINVDWVY